MGSNVDLRDQLNNPQVKDTLGQLFSGKKGYKVKDDIIIKPCKNCRKPVKSTEKFCQECGTKVEDEIKRNFPSICLFVVPIFTSYLTASLISSLLIVFLLECLENLTAFSPICSAIFSSSSRNATLAGSETLSAPTFFNNFSIAAKGNIALGMKIS